MIRNIKKAETYPKKAKRQKKDTKKFNAVHSYLVLLDI
jgi:hypothetical protein